MTEKENDGFETINIGLSDTWNPEEENIIQGKLVEVKNGVGTNESIMYVLEREDKSQISVWDTTVLNNKMKMVNLLDEVRIKYLGVKKSPKSGRDYKDFDVAVKRSE